MSFFDTTFVARKKIEVLALKGGLYLRGFSLLKSSVCSAIYTFWKKSYFRMTTSWERTPFSKESYLVERRLLEGRLRPHLSAPSAQSYRTLFAKRPIVLLDRNEAKRKRLRKWEIFTCGQDDCLPNQMHFLVKEEKKQGRQCDDGVSFPFLWVFCLTFLSVCAHKHKVHVHASTSF